MLLPRICNRIEILKLLLTLDSRNQFSQQMKWENNQLLLEADFNLRRVSSSLSSNSLPSKTWQDQWINSIPLTEVTMMALREAPSKTQGKWCLPRKQTNFQFIQIVKEALAQSLGKELFLKHRDPQRAIYKWIWVKSTGIQIIKIPKWECQLPLNSSSCYLKTKCCMMTMMMKS